jgi:UDP-N-acetylmuramate--alanine ligase
VVTNIDREHMDCYRNLKDVKRTFLEFMDRVPFYGMVVLCNDDQPLRALLHNLHRRTVTYGTRKDSDFRITLGEHGSCTSPEQPMSRFRVQYRGKDLGEFHLHVPGAHNVLNATAAIAVGVGLDIGVEQIRAALKAFRGVDRRFQLRGRAAGVNVIDDYGHHPTEIRATLAAARQCGYRRIHVIFQPHRYTRTQALMDQFATSFEDAATVFVLDIYAASEAPIEGVTSEVLAGRVRDATEQYVRYVSSFTEAIDAVVANAEEGDMILTLGAGSVSQLGPQIVEALSERQKQEAVGR